MLLEGAVQSDRIILSCSFCLMRAVSGGIRLVSSRISCISNTTFQTHVVISGFFQKICQPVYHLTRLIDPYTDQIAVHITSTVTYQFLHGFHLINGQLRFFLDSFLLQFRIDRSDIFTDTGCCLSLLNDQNLCTFFSCRHGGDPSTGSASDYQYLGVNSLCNICLCDLRCCSQPVGRCRLLCLFYSNGLTTCLGNTVSSCGFNGICSYSCT